MKLRPPILLLLLGSSGCSVFSGGIPPPSSLEVSDSELIARVSLALKDAGIPGYQEIRIEAHEGTVTLGGPVDSLQTGGKAVLAARRVHGVRRVVSLLCAEGVPASGAPGESR